MSQFTGKDPDSGKDWGQEKQGTEDEMVEWLNGHELEQNLGDVKDREAWCAAVHGVAKCRVWLNNWITTWGNFPDQGSTLCPLHCTIDF